jgi:hypothetical protein
LNSFFNGIPSQMLPHLFTYLSKKFIPQAFDFLFKDKSSRESLGKEIFTQSCFKFHRRLLDAGHAYYMPLSTLVSLPTDWLIIVVRQHKEAFVHTIWEYHRQTDKNQIRDYLNFRNLIALDNFYRHLVRTQDPNFTDKFHRWVVERIQESTPNEFKRNLSVFQDLPRQYFTSCLNYLLSDQDIMARACHEVFNPNDQAFINELKPHLRQEQIEVLQDGIIYGRIKPLKKLVAKAIGNNPVLKQHSLQVLPQELNELISRSVE